MIGDICDLPYACAGSTLWKHDASSSSGLCLEDDRSLFDLSGGGCTQVTQEIFFRVAEKPLTALTMLGETSMHNVYMFVQTYDCIQETGGSGTERDQTSVALVTSRDGILVVT